MSAPLWPAILTDCDWQWRGRNIYMCIYGVLRIHVCVRVCV